MEDARRRDEYRDHDNYARIVLHVSDLNCVPFIKKEKKNNVYDFVRVDKQVG